MSQVPVIDISKGDRVSAHQAIDAACRDWGAFQLVGHGIDLRLLAALRRQMRAFFAQPVEAKRLDDELAEGVAGGAAAGATFFDSMLSTW